MRKLVSFLFIPSISGKTIRSSDVDHAAREPATRLMVSKNRCSARMSDREVLASVKHGVGQIYLLGDRIEDDRKEQ
jgi:hypothetical protein